jgi:hypothetical protein
MNFNPGDIVEYIYPDGFGYCLKIIDMKFDTNPHKERLDTKILYSIGFKSDIWKVQDNFYLYGNDIQKLKLNQDYMRLKKLERIFENEIE